MRRALAAFTRVVVVLGLVMTPQLSMAGGSSGNSNDRNSNSSYDRDGRDRDGRDRDGYDRDGYDRDGYDHDGFDRRGRDHDGHGRDDDFDVCHRDNGRRGEQTIHVKTSAWWGHSKHGDHMGPCTTSGSR